MADWLRYIASHSDLILALGADASAGEQHYNSFGQAENRVLDTFDPLSYGASNDDLARAFGVNSANLAKHYIEYGFKEHRDIGTFDTFLYAASNPDLAIVFGTNIESLTHHYLQYGVHENRAKNSFDALLYSASNIDLARAFGGNKELLTRHYIEFGAKEGRATNNFDALLYAASNPDLAAAFGTDKALLTTHYVTYGIHESRPLNSFDAFRYGASNIDLALAFGGNATLLVEHYLKFGAGESRPMTTFDALSYSAVNSDLEAAFGHDVARLTQHYLTTGVTEGRSTAFDPVSYLLGHSDLAGYGADGARSHWAQYGKSEGRKADPFGADQRSHDAAIGRTAVGTFEDTNDRDYFTFSVSAGQKVALALLRTDLVGSVVAGSGLQVFDSAGHLLSSMTMSKDGFDNWLSFTAGTSGTVYVTATAGGSIGAYKLGIARVGGDYIPGSFPAGGHFEGGAITDVFLGGNGYSSIRGGDGDDILGGGAGQDDFMAGAGADYMDGGSLQGADGTISDSVTYLWSPEAVTVYLDGRRGLGGHAHGDRLVSIEALFGSAFDDKLYASSIGNQINGGDGADQIYGGTGNDYFLFGGDGDDQIFGGNGSDTLAGGLGTDLLNGGEGFDVADYQLSESAVRVDLRTGAVGGGASGDVLAEIEGLVGSREGDILATANSSAYQQLLGYGGNDILIDRSTSENGAFVVGNSGDDLLIGANIRGDEGNDILVSHRTSFINRADGQSGADTYVVETSFHAGVAPFDFSLYIASFDDSDRIDLSQLRDESGHILELTDIQEHSSGNVIDLSGFKTASGATVFGYVQIHEQAGLFEPIHPIAATNLSAEHFIFSAGINWQGLLPVDFSIF